MAEVVWSGLASPGGVLNPRNGSDAGSRKCICGDATSATLSTMRPRSTGISVASAFLPIPSMPVPVCFAVRDANSCASGSWFRSRAGVASCHEKRASSGHSKFGNICVSWDTDGRRWSRLKTSATQDGRGQDTFLQTNSRDPQVHVPHQRLTTARGGEADEDTAHLRAEPDRKERGSESQSGEGRLLKTDLSPSTSEKKKIPTEDENHGNGFGKNATVGTIAAGLGLIIVFGGFGSLGILYKDQLNDFLIQFADFIEGYGPAGYGVFIVGYTVLELFAIPAIPLTMSSGLLFGVGLGTVIVSVAGTIAATLAFLIARYLARNRILEFARGNKKFVAIDKAIGADGFRVVTLLRLSPLLPFSVANYLYGLTSVEIGPYILGSWLGMLPGSWAYASAGALGRTFIIKEESESLFSGRPEQLWTLGLGVAATVFAAAYVTNIAKDALKDIED